MAAVPELCPHCHRPFKRLRAHLPHCKAAPRPNPGRGLGPGPATGSAAPGNGSGLNGAGPGARPGAAGKSSKLPPSPGAGQGPPGAGQGPPGAGQGLPGAAPGCTEAAAAAREGKAAVAQQGGGSGPGLCRQPGVHRAQQKVEPAVEDVAKSLDLLPEEVQDLPEKLRNGVKIVIEKHRARVLRDRSPSRSWGAAMGTPSTDTSPVEKPDPGRAAAHADTAQPEPREGTTVPQTTNTERRGLRAAKNPAVSSKGEKGERLKATEIPKLGDSPCRSNPSDLTQQEGIDQTVTKEKQMYPEVGVEDKVPLPALHTKNLHLSVTEGFRGHHQGTAKNYLSSTQKLRESKKQMALVSEPVLNARRDTELALHQFMLHTSKSQPICQSQASGRSTQAGALGLEWFPDLYPNYHRLSIFPGKTFQEDMGITVKPPKGNFSEGQQGPLSERRLLDVRLGELPAWLATCDFSPQGLLGGVQKAWSSYYDKYINVKRGGPAGISMLLAGYCLLSYGWNYQHIKCHRWRKYH